MPAPTVQRSVAVAALALSACAAQKTREPAADTGQGIRVPAEWEKQEAVWLQWPRSYESSDEPDFARIVATTLQYEDTHILTHDARTRSSAELALTADGGMAEAVVGGASNVGGFHLVWHDIANDNGWMRDNGPVYVREDGQLRIQDWGFDAWGGAFGRDVAYANDDAVPVAIGEHLELPVDAVDIVHERGNLEFNGTDTVVLNWTVIGDSNRNPGITKEDVESAMKDRFGVERVVLLEGAPGGDLTGGHVDGIARFIDAQRVVVADCSANSACEPGGADDQIYDSAASVIAAAGLTVLRWPFATSVRYRGVDMDTDYMNWLVGNDFVLTVGFGDVDADAAAKAQLEEWFPGRDVHLIDTLESWYNGGGVHCHTNDQPAL